MEASALDGKLDVPYYFARPTAPVTAGIVVLHEGDGMSRQLLRLCERLAAQGYAVVAPDLFFRTGGPGAHEDHRVQGGAVRRDQLLEDTAAARDVLRKHGATRVGVTGFCMGGAFTWHVALHGEGYDAAAGFYGPGIASDLGTPRCPTLLFFGQNDPWIPADTIAAVAAHHQDTVVYPDAGHAFMRDGSDFHVPEAAADAWARLLTHFQKNLAPQDPQPAPSRPRAVERTNDASQGADA
jgi:carboxymethylenebutenolidase